MRHLPSVMDSQTKLPDRVSSVSLKGSLDIPRIRSKPVKETNTNTCQ